MDEIPERMRRMRRKRQERLLFPEHPEHPVLLFVRGANPTEKLLSPGANRREEL
jgi:hypothetical protein